MNLLFDHDKAVADWVANLIGKPFVEPYTAIGTVDSTGRLTGGVVFNGFTGDAVEMSLAGRPMLSRGMLRAISHYVFEQLGCSRLAVHTSAVNKRVRKIAPRLGFRYEGTARRMYGKHHGLCYSITVDDLPAFKERWKL